MSVKRHDGRQPIHYLTCVLTHEVVGLRQNEETDKKGYLFGGSGGVFIRCPLQPYESKNAAAHSYGRQNCQHSANEC